MTVSSEQKPVSSRKRGEKPHLQNYLFYIFRFLR